jgi:hypothetical protein
MDSYYTSIKDAEGRLIRARRFKASKEVILSAEKDMVTLLDKAAAFMQVSEVH